MEIQIEILSLSFLAGMGALLNPCGFAMLPAYMGLYLSRTDRQGQGPQGTVRLALRGISLGAVVSAGFLTVFGTLALTFSLLSHLLGPAIPFIGAAVGLGLVALGLLMLVKNVTPSVAAVERLSDRIARSGRERGQQDLLFYYLYGIAYAIASIGCTFPIFGIYVGTALSGGSPLNALVQFGAYGLGMALPLMGLSLLLVFSKELVSRSLPAVMRGIRWVGGTVVLVGGAYLAYYYLVSYGAIDWAAVGQAVREFLSR